MKLKLAALVALPFVSGAVFAATHAGLVQISSDPYTNSTSQHKTEVEPDSFSHGSTIVSAFQVGRFYDGGASNIGVATSQDGGATWKQSFLPGITKFERNGPYDRVSDAAVAYDAAHGVWLVSSLAIKEGWWQPTGAAVLVNRSTDDGLTWSGPVTVREGGDSSFLDKNWTSCDNSPTSPYYGHCYTEWDDNAQGNRIQMSTSTDGGLTWGAALSTADGATGLGGQPVVQPDGTVIVPAGNANVSELISYVSKDGGQSWSETHSITQVQTHEVGGELRSEPLPSAEIDGAGKVYVVWQDCRFETACSANDIAMSTSTDGVTWSEPVRIPIDAVGSGVDHFTPAIAVDVSTSGATAELNVAYYYYPKANCDESTCELHMASISSQDGGATWNAPVEIGGPARLDQLAKTSQGVMVGDYISSSFSMGSAYPVFAFVQPTSGEQAVFSTSEGLLHKGALRPVQQDAVLTDRSDRDPSRAPLTRF